VANTWRSCAHGSRVVAVQNSRKKALRRSSGEEPTNGSTESFAWSGRGPECVRKKRPPLQRIEYQRVEGLSALFCRVHICGNALQTLTYHNHETWLRTLTETHNEGEICDTPRFWVSGARNANGARLSRRCYATLIESQHAWEALQRMMCSIRGPLESPNSGHNPYKESRHGHTDSLEKHFSISDNLRKPQIFREIFRVCADRPSDWFGPEESGENLPASRSGMHRLYNAPAEAPFGLARI